jgi:hypothetical protein
VVEGGEALPVNLILLKGLDERKKVNLVPLFHGDFVSSLRGFYGDLRSSEWSDRAIILISHRQSDRCPQSSNSGLAGQFDRGDLRWTTVP